MKVLNFQADVVKRGGTTNLTSQWLYKRLKKLVSPSGFLICETCGINITFDGVTIDHKIPKSLYFLYSGNIQNVENLQLVCQACNAIKGQRPLKEFLDELQQRNATIKLLKQQKHQDVICPEYPDVGVGLRLFGDKSEQNFVTERRKTTQRGRKFNSNQRYPSNHKH